VVVEQPQSTRVEEPTLLCNQVLSFFRTDLAPHLAPIRLAGGG